MATLAFETYVSCPRCTTSVPVNALVPRLTCSACQGEVVPDKLLHELKREPFWARLLQRRSISVEDVSLKGEIAWGEPLCPSCKALLPLPAALEAAAASGHLDCPACARRIVVRQVPAELIPPGLDYVTHLVGEEPSLLPGAAATVVPPETAKPILFPCPSCNASLPVDGSSRTVECTYCHANAYLPDDLWRKLHPVRTISRWYIHVDAESPRVKAYRKASRLSSWSILLFWVCFAATLAGFFSLGGLLRWAVGGLFALGAVFWFFAGIRWNAQSEGENWP